VVDPLPGHRSIWGKGVARSRERVHEIADCRLRIDECWIDCKCGERICGDLQPFGLPQVGASSGQASTTQFGNVNCNLEAAWARHCRPEARNHWSRLTGGATSKPKSHHKKLPYKVVRTKGVVQHLYPLPEHPGWFRVEYFRRDYFARNVR